VNAINIRRLFVTRFAMAEVTRNYGKELIFLAMSWIEGWGACGTIVAPIEV
jgi:hypothetical protein